MKRICLIKFIFWLFILPIFVIGQDRKNADEKQASLDVNVFSYKKGLVTELKRENFRLYEDNKLLEISSFSDENLPISVGFLIDSSQSLSIGTDNCREAALNFIDKSNPKNEYFVAPFSREVKLLSDFATANETAKVISESPYFSEKRKPGDTVLYDAIIFGLQNFSKAKNRRKVLFIFWDDGDQYNSGKFKELEKLVRQKNIKVYPIGCSIHGEPLDTLLDELAEISGGQFARYSVMPHIKLPPKIWTDKEVFMFQFSMFAEQLQHQFEIGFTAGSLDKDNKWRNLKVEIELEKELKKQINSVYTVHRKGYYPKSDIITDK